MNIRPRFRYLKLNPDQRQELEDWVCDHGINPRLIPVDSELGYDADTNEWRFESYVRGAGGIRVVGGEPVRVVLRCVRLSDPRPEWLDWPAEVPA